MSGSYGKDTDNDKSDTASKDQDWLRSEVVSLFQTATRSADKDMPTCVKLAELLYKLLPKGDPKKLGADADLIEKMRQDARREQ